MCCRHFYLLSTAFFVTILERHVSEAAINCPYLLERCVVAIIRAAIHLLPVTDSLCDTPTAGTVTEPSLTSPAMEDLNNSHSESAFNVSVPESSAEAAETEMASAIWKSLRLLKDFIPTDVMVNLSDRLGAGLLTFIR